MGSDFEHEASVLSEPLDVAFVAGVDEDWGIVASGGGGGGGGAASPVFVIDQVALLECVVALWIVVEVIESLCEEFLFVKFAAFGCNGLLLLCFDC